MKTRQDGTYWERACSFFRGSGFADLAGSYFIHNKNSETVKIGIRCQVSAAVGDGERLRYTENGREAVVPSHSEDPIFKRVEKLLRNDAPCFFIVSPDIVRRFTDNTLPQILFVQPVIEFAFSPDQGDGRISYARDATSEREGRALLRNSLTTPPRAHPTEPGEPGQFAELAADWVPAEDDTNFLARLTDAVSILQDHPDGKLTLTRAYEHRSVVERSPFELYELHARINGDYACGHFFCLRDGVYSLGVTPENVFEVSGTTLTVDVVAATCRSSDSAEFLAEELYQNPKQIKEHRSSLTNRQNRFRPFCADHSIRVVREMQIKALRNVSHLHSVFTGDLLPQVTVFDLLGNIFPLLGARPRQLLAVADAEEAPHRYYGGVVGHLDSGSSGCFLNIRNALLYDDVIHAKVGVGVMKESNPHSELVETRDKLSGLLEAVQRWRRSTPEGSLDERKTMSEVLSDETLALNGGGRIRAKEWPTYDKGYVDLSPGDASAALRAIESRRLFRYDNRPHGETEVGQLESELADFFGSRYALACSSGTTALALALFAAGIRPGDSVACPAFTFAATPSAIILAGAKPVIVEVDENLHMDPADLAAKLTPEVKAVVAVHMRGFACDIERLVAIADSHGIPLFEDSVPALGVDLGERKLGTFGKAGAFSTQSDKTINTGEGGFLLTSDRDLFERAIVLSGAYEQQLNRHVEPALPTISDLSLPIFSFRLDEVRGAMARHQLEGLEKRVATFQENYRYVASRLGDLAPIRLRQPVAESAFLGESLLFRIPGATAEQIGWFVRALNTEGIAARGLGDDARPNNRCFWNWRFAFPEETKEDIVKRHQRSATLLQETVDIPLSITLTEADCDDVVAAMTKICVAYGGHPDLSTGGPHD
ncbi:MAG TPA: aminotransferase class I/II-fold pyridoxal phosphate-dependent enzyme [Actinokineospora sp.]|nr:aminotransferase class I/II-fold pyridoxal phosphate-dependent enzyme [Actinokineospora sp.]